MKIFSIIISLFIQAVIYADSCVEIEPKYNSSGKYYIYNEEDERIANFQLKIKETSKDTSEPFTRKENGDLVFHIRVINVEPEKDDAGNSKIDLKDLKLDNKDLKIGDAASHIHSDIIKITIPKGQLSNERFNFETDIAVCLNGKKMKVDKLYFVISPILSIEFDDNTQEKEIKFGKITYDNGFIRSSEKHNFTLKYTCITEPHLEVTSDHNFSLAMIKNEMKIDQIPYRLWLNINGTKTKISTESKFKLPSNLADFTNYLNGRCYIKTEYNRIPTAGKYIDTVTFVIKP